MLVLSNVLWASQVLGQEKSIKVSGVILEDKSSEPVPYATVSAFDRQSKALITGATTDFDGRFRFDLTTTEVYFLVSFIGFSDLKIEGFTVEDGKIRLGRVKLRQDAQLLNEVQIEAERSSVEFKLDKKVFNVGSDLSNSGVSAMEVLDNVPSVNVDVEGNISLRGNSGVQILIDGKPSILADEGATALGSLTSDMIASVEVITNPSAKYQAEGSSGIINIVLKKEEKKGLNGSISVNTGMPHNHSIGGSINRRTEKFNLFTQFGVGYRSIPRFTETVNQNLVSGTVIESKGVDYRNEAFANITLGADYYINKYNTITLSGRYAFEDETQPAEMQFEVFNAEGELVQRYDRITEATAGNPKYQFDVQYEKRFKKKKDHVLQMNVLGRFFGKDIDALYRNESISGLEVPANQRAETSFFEERYTVKVDYKNPLTEFITIELGSMYEMNDVGNNFAVYNQWNNDWVVDPSLTNDFHFNQQVLGVYTTGAYESEKWGLKLGVRAEHTHLLTELRNTNEVNDRQFLNFFPSAHTSYKFSEKFSMQAGYSRRIYRPRLWDLNPFFSITNSFRVRTGNPDLNPEYADSYELTSIFLLGKLSFNVGLYHLYTTEVIERVASFKDNVNITLPMNIGTRNQTGFEFNGKYSPKKWLVLNGDFNFGYFSRVGSFNNRDFTFTGSNWFTRGVAKFKLPADADIEVSGNYQSRFRTVQGESIGFAHMNVGLRKRLFDGKLIFNAGVKDVFASRVRAREVVQERFYLYSFSQRGRFITAGLSLGFGKGDAMYYGGGKR